MDLGLDGRIALVMASTDGLGAAIAASLARHGAQVIITGRRADDPDVLAAAPEGAVPVVVDLDDPCAIENVVRETRSRVGDPDILVLNGPGPAPGRADSLRAGAARAAVDRLLVPHVELLAELLPHMRHQGWGRILAVGSSGVEAPLANLAASNLGRAALAAYLKTLASEVGRDGVTVNMLLPGRIATGRVASLDEAAAQREGRRVEEIREASKATIPLARYGTPEEFGAVAAFLCGTPASYVTGALVRCDGGLLSHL